MKQTPHNPTRLFGKGTSSTFAALALLAGVVGLGATWSSGCYKETPQQASSDYPATPLRGKKPPPAEAVGTVDNVDPPDKPSPETTEKKPPVRFSPRKPDAGPKAALAVPAESTRDRYEPIVALTKGHADKCLVKVGDTFPEFKLTDTEGSEADFSQLRGEKLTVVVFWNKKKVYAAEQFSLLRKEVADAYSKFGVGLVAINEGDSAEAVAQLKRQYEIEFPCLLDPDGALFKQVATDKLPRTYLLDPQGKILWFDLEYSQTTRYELKNAVYFYLK